LSISDQALRDLDSGTPNVARIYDYFLGGKDNFAADRAAASQIAEAAPEVVRRVKENRAFLGRAVSYLAKAGITQFIDIGTGLPTRENVHQVAGRVAPGAKVAYVDNDPVVLTHARALLATDPCTVAIEADMRVPDTILDAIAHDQFIDMSRPVAILMIAVLHFLPDDDEVAGIVATYRDRMAPGSYLAITHATVGSMSEKNLSQAVRTYATTSAGSITPRSPEQIEAFFGGLVLQDPGLVPVAHWRPEEPAPAVISGATFLGGVARKPGAARSPRAC
jgi:O-methyltransferase involved in polyketide biosynthesis